MRWCLDSALWQLELPTYFGLGNKEARRAVRVAGEGAAAGVGSGGGVEPPEDEEIDIA